MVSRIAKSPHYRFVKDAKGYTTVAPTLKGLVLSGGGARGIAYPGMLHAMVELGTLEQITHIAGASAGAMTGSFIAVGYDYKDIERLLTQLKITNLLDKPGYAILQKKGQWVQNLLDLVSRAKGQRFQNLLDIVYYVQIKKYLSELPQPNVDDITRKSHTLLSNKVALYKRCLDKNNLKINNVTDIIELSKQAEKMPLFDNAFKLLQSASNKEHIEKKASARFTFADLEALRTLLPPKKKHEIKSLSVVTTNQTQKTLVVHNYKTSPNESIAQCSQESGAHPFLFSPRKNSAGDYIADGALQDNMPAHVLEDLGLSTHEILCVALTTELKLSERLTAAKGCAPHTLSELGLWLDTWFDSMLGTKLCDYFAKSYNREKLFYHYGNMLYLNAGDLSITDVNPNQQQKKFALDKAYEQTKVLFANRNQHFSSAVMAMLFLGDVALDEVIRSQKDDHDLFFPALKVKNIFNDQRKVIETLKKGSTEGIRRRINSIVFKLNHKDLKLTKNEQEKARTLCYKQINFLSDGLFEAYCREGVEINQEKAPEKASWFASILALLQKSFDWVCSSIQRLFFSPQEIEAPIKIDVKPVEPLKKTPSLHARFFNSILEDIITKDSVITLPRL